MELFIQFKLTEKGKSLMLGASDGTIEFSLARAYFSGNNLNIDTMHQVESLENVLMVQDIAPGTAVKNNNALYMPIKVVSGEKMDIRSIGLYTENGDLIAVASVASGVIFSLYPSIPLIIIFVMVIVDESITEYQTRINPNASILQAFLDQHCAANHPHLRYLHDPIFQDYKQIVEEIVNEFLHVGVWIGTDNKDFQPSSLIYSLLGIDTVWQTKQGAPLGVIGQADPTGVLSNIGGGNSSYLANTTLMWQRVS